MATNVTPVPTMGAIPYVLPFLRRQTKFPAAPGDQLPPGKYRSWVVGWYVTLPYSVAVETRDPRFAHDLL